MLVRIPSSFCFLYYWITTNKGG